MPTYPAVTGRMLDRTKDGRSLSFQVASPQRWRDDWRGTDRVMRYYGPCTICGTRTYAFDDGENDPRGVLGDHAADPFNLSDHLAADDAAKVDAVGGVELPACFCCTNDYDRYRMLVRIATHRARHKGADV